MKWRSLHPKLNMPMITRTIKILKLKTFSNRGMEVNDHNTYCQQIWPVSRRCYNSKGKHVQDFFKSQKYFLYPPPTLLKLGFQSTDAVVANYTRWVSGSIGSTRHWLFCLFHVAVDMPPGERRMFICNQSGPFGEQECNQRKWFWTVRQKWQLKEWFIPSVQADWPITFCHSESDNP